MCPATSPSHSDLNQHCHVSNDLISFAHRAVLNPKVSSFVALYSIELEIESLLENTRYGNFFERHFSSLFTCFYLLTLEVKSGHLRFLDFSFYLLIKGFLVHRRLYYLYKAKLPVVLEFY